MRGQSGHAGTGCSLPTAAAPTTAGPAVSVDCSAAALTDRTGVDDTAAFLTLACCRCLNSAAQVHAAAVVAADAGGARMLSCCCCWLMQSVAGYKLQSVLATVAAG